MVCCVLGAFLIALVVRGFRRVKTGAARLFRRAPAGERQTAFPPTAVVRVDASR